MKETRLTSTRRISMKFCLLLFLIFSASISNAFAQATVTGVVTDEQKDPLPGVSIIVKGSTTGTVTDFDGNYSINAKSSDVLLISYLGMKSQEITVGSKTKIDVVLADDSKMLETAVVIGYGSAKAKDLTSPIATLNAEDVNRHLTASPMQGLQGKVAGLQITNTGAPGSSPQVRIRGVGSLENDKSGPLYVVDGMFVDNIDFLSNNDIVNISILKDASASAIYGVRAANGVVIVTTKTGGMNRPTEITYDGFAGIQNPTHILKMANSGQYSSFMKEANNTAGLNAINNSITLFGGNNGIPNTNTDWFSEILRPAFMNSHSITATGGSDKVAYTLNTNYLNQRGVADSDNGFERLNVRAQLDANLYKWLKVGANILLVNSNNRTIDNGPTFSNAYATPSIVPVFDDKNLDAFPYRFAAADGVMSDSYFRNPMASLNYYNNVTKERSVLPTFYAQFILLDDKLTLKSSFNQKVTTRKNNIYKPRYFVSSNQQAPISNLEAINYEENSWLFDNIATYRDSYNKDHNFTAMLGHSVRQTRIRKERGIAENVPEPEHLWLIDNGSLNNRQAFGEGNTTATVSLFGRLMYDYKGRYLLSATYRMDGSSKYSKRWGYFPSVGLGWVLTQEDFMKDQHFFDFLKLRGSWGRLGNDNVDSNNGFVLKQTSAMFNNERIGALNTLSFAGDTQWEVVEETNLGLDFGILNNRLSGELDYYRRTTQNAIIKRALPFVTETILANAGSIRNSGIELTLNWSDQIKKDLSYNVGFNLSTVKNEVLSIGIPGQNQQFMNDFVIRRVGEAVNSFYGYKVEGVYQNQAEIDSHLKNMDAKDRPKPGDFRYADTDGDGKITSEDRQILGSALPKLFIGGNLGFNYKDFDFNVAMQGNFGGKIINNRRFNRVQHPTSNIDADLFENRWTGEGSSNTHVSSEGLFRSWNYGVNGSLLSSNFVESSSSFTIQNIQLGYTFKNLFPEKNNKASLRINFTAERPFSFFSYNGFTPEITNEWGFDTGIYPLSSVYSLGVKLIY